MSLQIAAKHLASHGRGSDTTLVHMTPGEVASLQSLAQQHGGSLTTNPHTGLPEAGFLSALLPMAAGAGLAAMGMPAGYAALAVGATSAATSGGDLKKGLMAGMSAYGGAGMAESFMGAGLGTMGGAMAAPAAEAAPAVAAAPAVSAAPAVAEIAPSAGSIAGSSMQEAVNQSGMYAPAITSAAPAEVAKQAAAATPAAQAAQQSAALNELTMGQRWDALKAGATGANAMKYVKDNPFTSLGVAASFMAPDENKAPQTTTDTDRGPRAGMQYHPGWSTPMPKPNMQGIEQTYNRPYYAAEGGITHMAEGGSTGYKDYDGVEMSPAMRELLAQQDRSLREIQRLKAQQAGTPPAQLDQKQLFADYLQRVSGGAGTGTDTGAIKPELPFLETPVASNTRGGGSGRTVVDEGGTWTEPTSQQAYNWSQAGKQLGVISPLAGGLLGMYGNYLARNVDPNYSHESMRAPKTTATEGESGANYSHEGVNAAFPGANYSHESMRAPVPSGGATAYPVPLGAVDSFAFPGEEKGAYMPQGSFGYLGSISTPVGSLSTNPVARVQELAARDEATERAAGLAAMGIGPESNPGDTGRGGGGAHVGGGGEGGQGAATGGNNGDASGGGDRGTRGGFAQGGDIHGGLSNPYNLGSYSDGGRLLKGPGDGVSDSIPATIGKGRPARLADGEFVVPARIVSEIGNGSTEAGARKLYAMMDRIQAGRKKSIGKDKVAVNSRADKHLPA